MPSLGVGLDLGTGNIGIAAQHLDGKETSKTAPIIAVTLKNTHDRETSEVKQTVVYRADETLVYGTDVKKALRVNPGLQDGVMELCKLALHPEFRDVPEVVHVKRVLSADRNRGALQDFFTDLLKCIARDVRDFFKRRFPRDNGTDSTSYWTAIPLVFQISVPAMWGDVQRGIIRNAARKAGISKVELREEPLCVATAYIHQLGIDGFIKQAQCLLQIDCGKGTLDLATVLVNLLQSADQDMELKRIGLCSGNGFGAHTPNLLFWAWIKSGQCAQVPDLEAECQRLHITEREFMRQASDGFDLIKKLVDPVTSRYTVYICGTDGNENGNDVAIHAPRELVADWYAQWISGAVQLVKEHIARIAEFAAKHNIKLDYGCAVVTGGGSKSDDFTNAMQQVLNELSHPIEIVHIPMVLACARGTLMQHVFQEDRLPPVSHFYIARTEYYKRGKHRKADAQVSQWDTSEEIVPDRLQHIMTYQHGEFTGRGLTAQTFYVSADGSLGRLHVDLYWSEQRFRSGTALRDEHGEIRAGIRCYPLVFADPGDLAQQGFITENVEGEDHFLVKGWAEMKGTMDALELTVYLMKYGYQYPGEHPAVQQRFLKLTGLSGNDHLDTNEVLGVYPEGVWDKDSSHFVSSSTGQVARD